MKKIVLILALTSLFAFSGCSTVKGASKSTNPPTKHAKKKVLQKNVKAFSLPEQLNTDENGYFLISGHYTPNTTLYVSIANNPNSEQLSTNSQGDFLKHFAYPQETIDTSEKISDILAADYAMVTVNNPSNSDEQILYVTPSKKYVKKIISTHYTVN